jgi:hypothetical protein
MENLNEEYKGWIMFSYLRKILCLIMLLICSYEDIKNGMQNLNIKDKRNKR